MPYIAQHCHPHNALSYTPVATQFLTHLFIKFLKNPKIAKNNENPKKIVFYIFASFLAFSASSQKNLIFQRSFEHIRLFTCHF